MLHDLGVIQDNLVLSAVLLGILAYKPFVVAN